MKLLGLNLKNPISLKWKWSVLIFIALTILGVSSVVVYRQAIQSQQLTYLQKTTQTSFERMKSWLEHNQVDFDTLASDVSQHQAVLSAIQDDETVLRFFNKSNQLVYETKRIEVPTLTSKGTIETVTHKNKLMLVGTVPIYASGTTQTIGSVQYVVEPLTYLKLVQQQQQWTWQVCLMIVLIAGVFAYFIARYFLLPLNYLNNTLDLVEEESLSTIRVRSPKSHDEWSDLNVHINRLLDKIDRYVQNQKQFVEDVSHELRTPVAIVEGHLKMLNRWGKDDPVILEESISASLQEITRMKDLVQMMLDLSRAEHAEVDYKDEITEIYSATRQVFSNFVMLYPEFQFYLDSEDESKELYVKMYKNHFEQILIILMDNAVKYSTNRKEIHVAVSTSFTTVEIAVQDFGEGMSEADKERVFGRFYRVDKARSREKGGNGLGLSIAKQLVESYKGKIYVESVLQHGSIFYIEFPIIVDKSEIHKGKQYAIQKSL